MAGKETTMLNTRRLPKMNNRTTRFPRTGKGTDFVCENETAMTGVRHVKR